MGKQRKAVRQAAVIAMRRGRICLITSSSGKHWLLPKGNLEPGLALHETALLEAWEEAGLKGKLKPKPVGSYRFEKLGKTHEVVVFRMSVTTVKKQWPEKSRRRRRWLSPAKAIDNIDHAELREIVGHAVRRRRAA